MKRSELKRKTPLARKVSIRKWMDSSLQGEIVLPLSPLTRGKPLKRRHGLKHKPSKRLEAIPRESWYALLKGRPNRKMWDVHHVVYAQHVRQHGGSLWDPRNGLPVLRDRHEQHHRGRKLLLTELRDENFEYARELLGDDAAYEYLRRRYRGDDPRLDALIEEAA